MISGNGCALKNTVRNSLQCRNSHWELTAAAANSCSAVGHSSSILSAVAGALDDKEMELSLRGAKSVTCFIELLLKPGFNYPELALRLFLLGVTINELPA